MISPIKVQTLFINHPQVEGLTAPYTGFTFRFEHRKWNRGRNGLHQLGQPVVPSVLFPAFKYEGEPGTHFLFESMRYRKVIGEYILLVSTC